MAANNPATIVTLRTNELAANYVGLMNPAALAPLEAAIMNDLNANGMGVINVNADIVNLGASTAVKLSITPAGLDVQNIKLILR